MVSPEVVEGVKECACYHREQNVVLDLLKSERMITDEEDETFRSRIDGPEDCWAPWDEQVSNARLEKYLSVWQDMPVTLVNRGMKLMI